LLEYLKSLQTPIIAFDDLCRPSDVDELALPLTENRVDLDPLYMHATRLFAREIGPDEFMREVISILYRVGAVGVKPSPGDGYYYSHRDEPVMSMAGISGESRIRIHPMLHRSMGIDPRRDNTK
jgi:hypothetical protein